MGIYFWDPARAVKITLRRAVSSGAPGDDDVYGAAMHMPLMGLVIAGAGVPWSRARVAVRPRGRKRAGDRRRARDRTSDEGGFAPPGQACSPPDLEPSAADRRRGEFLVVPLSLSGRRWMSPTHASIAAGIEHLVSATGRLDILVDNAGINIGNDTPAEDLDPEVWRRMLDVNATGPFLCSQQAARQMIPQGRRKIINVASAAAVIMGEHTERYITAYSTSKAAVVMLTRSLALQMGPPWDHRQRDQPDLHRHRPDPAQQRAWRRWSPRPLRAPWPNLGPERRAQLSSCIAGIGLHDRARPAGRRRLLAVSAALAPTPLEHDTWPLWVKATLEHSACSSEHGGAPRRGRATRDRQRLGARGPQRPRRRRRLQRRRLSLQQRALPAPM